MATATLSHSDFQMSPSLRYKHTSYESDSTASLSDTSSAHKSLESLPNNEEKSNIFDLVDSCSSKTQKISECSDVETHNFWKVFLVAIGIFLLFIGRFQIPNNDVEALTDNVLDLFQPINDWIHRNADSIGPKLLLFCCATNMDIIFFATVYFWFKEGKTGRILISITIFYVTRSLVQLMSFQPIPKGYYWESPGFPSFVAPYGRTTDFFFSGHSGFLVLMGNEWKRCGYKKVHKLIMLNLIYTIFVLLSCQGHYSIDIFTGVFFADYVFNKVDEHKDTIDEFFKGIAKVVEKNFMKIFKIENDKKLE